MSLLDRFVSDASRPGVDGAASPINRLIEAFHRLPGIGPKSAQRLAYHVLRAPEEEATDLADALTEVKRSVVLCERCQNLTDTNPCRICLDTGRDRTIVCVVEEPLDVQAIERTGGFSGLYHVLHGVISPSDGVGPEELKIAELLTRIRGRGYGCGRGDCRHQPEPRGGGDVDVPREVVAAAGVVCHPLGAGAACGG